MYRKIATLEEENKSLRSDIHEVVAQTDEIEEQERKIMEDLSKQLIDSNQQLDSLNLELERYKEENRLQYEEIVSLTKRCHNAELQLHSLMTENDETTSMLCITKENQDLLAQELAEFKVRYTETCTLLQETQDMLKKYVKKFQPTVKSSLIPGGFTNHFSNNTSYINDSLHTELLDSLDSGILSDPGNAPGRNYQNVNDTMKFVQNSTKDSNMFTNGMPQMEYGSSIMSTSTTQSRLSTFAQPSAIDRSNQFYSTIYGSPVSVKPKEPEDEGFGSKKLGDMGTPGAKDLEEALKRLTPAEILSRRAMLSYSPAGTYSYDEPPLCRTPESIMSTLSSVSTTRWQMPKKLEIVKPLEGSMTLNQWKGLATPTFGGLLQDNVHVKVRGERKLEDLGVQMYSLSDLEEDVEDHPGKQFDQSSCIYTFTNSTVMHPEDGTSITFSLPPSQISSRMQSTVTSRQATAPPTPRNLSRRNSCSTFSMNMGLASVLNERGIKAVTPSCLNTPTGQNFSPTVTPCNSPESTSPLRPLSPEPGMSSSSQIKNKSALLHLEKKALRSLKLLEKVELFGFENVMATTPSCRISPLALYSSNIYTHRSSPMAQLTSLKYLTDKRNSDENLKSHLQSTSQNEVKSPTESNPKKHHSDRKFNRVQRTRSRRNILSNGTGQIRQDLGTVHVRTDLGKIDRQRTDDKPEEEKSIVGEFVGTISSLLFGRKGGLL
ncbi:trafficking kinesin-binding protein milt-like isoform X2 [Chironomus tepperi]